MKILKYSRSIMVFAFILVLSLTAIASTVDPVEPRQIVLTWQNDPQTTMTITWRTDVEGEKSIAYFSSDDGLEVVNYEKLEAETFTFEETAAWLHSVEITGLTPATTYWAVLETDGKRSEKFSFKTAPDKAEDVVFVIGADAQHVRTQIDVIREVFRKAAEEDPDFFVYSGDFVNAELSDFEWDIFFDTWDELMITDEGRRIPIMPTPGNHEVVAGYGGTRDSAVFFYNRFLLPEPQNYYALQYGPDLTVFTLNSNHTSPIDGDQLAWLENSLEEHKDSKWMVAHYHDGSWWGTETMHAKIRNYWVPLFEEYGVDIVHSGHSHSYARTVPVFGIGAYAEEIDEMIEKGLEQAKVDFDKEKNYAPPLQKNFVKLSRGDWEGTGFASLDDGLRNMAYMLSLFIIQTGEPTEERVFDQLSSTKIFANFWSQILSLESNDEMIDDQKGVTYLVGGGLGSELGGYDRDPEGIWWLEDSKLEHHYRRIEIDASENELSVVPFFYDPETGAWEEGNAIVKKD